MERSKVKLEEHNGHYGRLRNYINGKWEDSESSQIREVINPATGEVIAEAPLSTPEEVKKTVEVAQAAFREWRETPPTRRARYFFELQRLMEENFEELSKTVVREVGKTLDEARGELRRSIEEVECACGIPSLMFGYLAEDIAPTIDLQAINEPLGVFCMVPAFNFPALVPLEYMPYAVACGNTYIVKPSTEVPITQVKIFELIDKIGLPPGVVNLVHGSRNVVNNLLENPDMKGLSFVGSSPVGKLLYEKAAKYGKRAQCAGGAKNHFVIMPDADLDMAVNAMLSSFFGCSGQRCLAGAVAVPVGDVYEPLKEKFVEAASKIKLGYGLDEGTQMGALVSKEHMQSVLGFIEKGIEEGAKLLLDGRNVHVDGYPHGAFVGPTIFDEVKPDMTIAQEEIFGPVASIIKADDFEEALELIEGSRFGHSALIFTSSGYWAREFRYRVPCGNIGINIGVAATQAFSTLGSYKESFYGDLHGRAESVKFFTDRKIVITRWF
ncbi:MAG: CoA-acylating methylmalonate-semialdehyde dehydrogenase [Desulfobacteraceae bacterium]|nr:CoA-acylating methylmalonate-semialdehyde dehydrogenase [Desulfobacteraceae bacterium]